MDRSRPRARYATYVAIHMNIYHVRTHKSTHTHVYKLLNSQQLASDFFEMTSIGVAPSPKPVPRLVTDAQLLEKPSTIQDYLAIPAKMLAVREVWDHEQFD